MALFAGSLMLLGTLVVLVGVVVSLVILATRTIERPVDRVTCGMCGYEVEGIPSDAPCPECGSPPAARKTVRDRLIFDRAGALAGALILIPLWFVPMGYGLWWARAYRSAFPDISQEFIDFVSYRTGGGVGLLLVLCAVLTLAISKRIDPARWQYVCAPIIFILTVFYPMLAWHSGCISWNPVLSPWTGFDTPALAKWWVIAGAVLCPLGAWSARIVVRKLRV